MSDDLMRGVDTGVPTATAEAHSAMQRIAVLEARCRILEKAMHAAFGTSWMEQVLDDVARDMNNEPTGE